MVPPPQNQAIYYRHGSFLGKMIFGAMRYEKEAFHVAYAIEVSGWSCHWVQKILCAQDRHAFKYLIEHAKLQHHPSVLERLPSKLFKHIADTGCIVISVQDKTSSPTLDHFKLVNIHLSVGVPGF